MTVKRFMCTYYSLALMGLLIMKLKNFIGSSLCQVALVSVLVTTFYSIPASAVELIGTPTAVGQKGKVQPTHNDQAHDHAMEAEHMSMGSRNDKSLHADHESVMDSDDDTTEDKSIEGRSVEDKSDEESLELIKEHNRHMEAMSRPQSNDDSKLNSADILVPITAIVFSIGGAILLIMFLAKLHYRDKERRAQNINANIDRLLAAGRDIPVELLRGDESSSSDESSILRDNINLHKGLKNVCLGAGLFVFLSILVDIEIGAVGFILMGLGASQLLLWKLSGVKTNVMKGQD